MRRALHLLAVVLAAIVLSGCTAALSHPPVVVPDRPLRPVTIGTRFGRVAVVTIAAVGTSSGSSLNVEPDRSRTVAEWIHREVIESLTALGCEVGRPSRSPPPGYFDSETRFEEVGINYYGGGKGSIGGGYYGRIKIPAFYCVDDSILHDPEARQAWTEVLGLLHTLRQKRAGSSTLSRPDRLRGVVDADALLIVVSRVRRIPAGQQVRQGAIAGLMTLGMVPAYEPSSCAIHAYLLDLSSGEFRWADACLANRADSLGIETACEQLFRRWP